MTKTRIVLADDHAVLRQGLKHLIEAEPDMEVVGEAADGAEVLPLVTKLKPDVVVMDLSMAGMGGAEATRLLKQHDPGCKILVLTVHEDRNYLRELLEAGALGYMLKRSPAEEIVQAIRAIAKGTVFIDSRIATKLITVMVDDRASHAVPEAPEVTPREFDVLRHIAEGFSNKEIAARFVIADDDALLLSRLLVEKAAPGAMVATIRGARGAMDYLLHASNREDLTTLLPDVILLDLNMPGMDGFELLRWVRRNQSLAAVKVVMLASSEAAADMKRATELGAHGYLIKYPNASCLAGLLKQAMLGQDEGGENRAVPYTSEPVIDPSGPASNSPWLTNRHVDR